MKKQFLTFGAIALMTATAAPRLAAAEADVKADVDLPKSETRVHRDRDADVTVREHTKLRHSQRASGLLGMEVRNRENQKLGEIKDLVLETPNKVSYAVLAVGGVLGIGEKLIALPPTALQPAQDGEYLILNADKAKIQAAPGFAATAWPSATDPDINRFWSDIKATGAPATVEKNHKSSVDVNVDTDRKTKIYTDADKDKKIQIDVDKK